MGVGVSRGRAARGILSPGAGILLCCALISFLSSVCGFSDPSEVNALNTMFVDFNQDPKLTGWDRNNGDPCGTAWYGIVCSPDNFVVSIKIPGLGLNGKMQVWVLQNLRRLQVVDVSYNNISGDLPKQLPSSLNQLIMNNNLFSGGLPQFDQMRSLEVINLSNNQLDDKLESQLSTALVKLRILDLSNNKLEGGLLDSVKTMTALQTLNLQNNKLSGQLPASLVQLKHLQTFNIENNNFTGYLPSNFRPQTYKYGGNQLELHAPPPPPGTPTRSSAGSVESSFSAWFTITRIVVVAAGAAALVLALLSICFWFCIFRNRPNTSPKDPEANRSIQRPWFIPRFSRPNTSREKSNGVFEPAPLVKGVVEEAKVSKASPSLKALKAPPSFRGSSLLLPSATSSTGITEEVTKSSILATAFSVADLQAATNSFSQDNLIGEGNMGEVYRAESPDGQFLAVKKLNSNACMVQHEDDFLRVVEGLARLQHSSAVALVGYCAEHDQRLLVYEYFGRGSLHDKLHFSNENSKGLSWNVRIKIALGSARALKYLHEVCAPPVVHRNFSSANILLDDELNPHISDCGLAILASSGSESEVSAQLTTSFGYSAPEYAMFGTYTVKSDIYSFGVVMLELLTGRKPFDSTRPRSEQSLVRWATPQLHDIDALARMVDPALKGMYPAKSLSRFADVVALCVQPEPEFRPPMSEVVQSLVRLIQRASMSKRGLELATQTDTPNNEFSENSV
ncbi:protein STRUBBELIG-RECEPTOR FAMILY 8 isoform X2 [Physcomitrium patens]|uniref:Protein kinase domain-containing protein n=1 Tax=Physcomitrium patens TaxID=3218 RepID=A0A2K1KN64_PHYPA|nr:protein STRUBBELIG-RECEPTOR FAMILY 8-like isoform X2 [Physcomitrium patens]PNR55220.1 hypothetical protein PHYPA_006115 [Physcomitrium patens]|eukprot:XP_024372956.1 protein STRUBBELIG-RECEPTOR FAMILY 8-like isoform X2 [Physcomitrella patens]